MEAAGVAFAFAVGTGHQTPGLQHKHTSAGHEFQPAAEGPVAGHGRSGLPCAPGCTDPRSREGHSQSADGHARPHTFITCDTWHALPIMNGPKEGTNMKGNDKVHCSPERVPGRRADRHQPVHGPFRNVRQLAVQQAARGHREARHRGDEARREAHRPHPVPGGQADRQPAEQDQHRRHGRGAAQERPGCRARARSRATTRASRSAWRWATAARAS